MTTPDIDPVDPGSFVGPTTTRLERVAAWLPGLAAALAAEFAESSNTSAMTPAERERLITLGSATVQVSIAATQLGEAVAARLGQPLELAAASADTPGGSFETTYAITARQGDQDQDPAPTSPAAQAVPATSLLGDVAPADKLPVAAPTEAAAATPADPAEEKAAAAAEEEPVDLYQKLISPDRLPPVYLGSGIRPTEIVIVSDDTIQVDDQRLKLTGDALFLFNALLLLRDGMRRSGEIRQFGFREGVSSGATTSKFVKAIDNLARSLERITGTDVVLMDGQKGGKTYGINPAVVLADKRPKDSPGVVDTAKKA